MIGVAYMDDCFILGLNYVTGYTYGSGAAVLNHTVMLQLSLRTLGGTTVSQALSQTSQ
jgi:LPS-assembly protein